MSGELYSNDRPGQIEPAATAPRLWTSLVVATIVIAGLYAAQEVLVPIVLAVLLSFVLAIPAGSLQRLGVGRRISVTFVAVVAFVAILGIGTLLTLQLTQLATDLPKYQSTIREKITSLRGTGSGGPIGHVVDMVQSLGRDMKPATPPEGAKASPSSSGGQAAPGSNGVSGARPVPVEIADKPASPIETIGGLVSPLLHPLATAGLVVIFVVFILLQRGDLRNRFIRLVGSNDLQRTTEAMNDAARRLSRFFLMQVLLNASFGVIIGLGLWAIGVPSPVLWGIFGAVSRFVPYVGAVAAAGLPILLAAAVDPNWSMTIETAALFLVVELTIGQVIEPLAYGHSTGLSPVAVITSVTFWTWLWGPIGLLLATPLTVCVVVLGRHVEQMKFLDVMLGDQPPLTEAETFYQRILAGDPTEPTHMAELFLKEHSLSTYYDRVAVEGLALAQSDVARGSLDEAKLDKIDKAVADLIDNLSDYDDVTPEVKRPTSAEPVDGQEPVEPDPEDLKQLSPDAVSLDWREGTPILCVASRNALDRAGAAILAQLLGKHGLAADVEGSESLSASGIFRLPSAGRKIICLCYLDTTSPVHVRYAVRRLRRKAPQATIILGAWGLDDQPAKTLCETAKADYCAVSMHDALAFCITAAQGGGNVVENGGAGTLPVAVQPETDLKLTGTDG